MIVTIETDDTPLCGAPRAIRRACPPANHKTARPKVLARCWNKTKAFQEPRINGVFCAWECGFLMEEQTSTSRCGNLFTRRVGDLPPVTESDTLEQSKAFREKMDCFSHTKNARAML